MIKYPLIAFVVILLLFGIGYFPSTSYDSPGGVKGLILGLSLAFLIMTPTCFIMVRAITKSQQAFMIAFGSGLMIRLLIVVVAVFIYIKMVEDGVFSFVGAFFTGYVFLFMLEFYVLKQAVNRRKALAKEEER